MDIADLPTLVNQFRPRADQLIVLPFIKAGASFLVDMSEDREQPEKGMVLCVGPGAVGPETGRPVPVVSTVGEIVAFGKYAGLSWELAADRSAVKVFILRDSEVLLAAPAGSIPLVMHEGDPRKVHEEGRTCEHCTRVEGEEGVNRLRAIAGGLDPDAMPDEQPPAPSSAIDDERARLRQLRSGDWTEPASVADAAPVQG